MAGDPHSGGCLCGAVRFTASADPLAVRQCWCRVCQYLACGSPTVNAFFPADAVTITGTLSATEQVADSGNRIVRRFCPSCGTQVTTAARARPHLLGVRVGTMDDPRRYPPAMAIWTSAAPDWACIDPALPRVERQPPPAG